MKSKNLYIIESPLQLINANEAKYNFNLDNNLLVVKYSNDLKNNLHLDNILKTQQWNKVYKIFPINSKLTIFLFIKLLFSLKFKKINTIFIGEFRSDYMWFLINNLKHNQHILLDDGNMTIEVQKSFLSDLESYNKSRNKNKDIIFKTFLLKDSTRSMIDLFSMFSMASYNNQVIYMNKFSSIQDEIKTFQTTKKNQVYFIGGNLLELGIISKEYFFNSINYISTYYKLQNKSIIYIPHRREDNKKIKLLEEKYSFEIVYFDNPIELEFLYNKTLPLHIASFYSTALISLKKLYNIECIDSFRLENNEVHQEFLSEVKSVYDYYGKELNIVKLDIK